MSHKKVYLQYCDPNSILMINSTGRMRKLYTPFLVLCIQDSGAIEANTKVYVQEVQSTSKDELVYIIAGTAYYHSYFRIEAKF